MGAEGHDDAGSSHVEHVEHVDDGLSTIGSSDNHAFLEAGGALKRNNSHDKMEGGCMLRRNMSRQNMEEMQEVMQEQMLIKSSATEATNVLEQMVSDSLQGEATLAKEAMAAGCQTAAKVDILTDILDLGIYSTSALPYILKKSASNNSFEEGAPVSVCDIPIKKELGSLEVGSNMKDTSLHSKNSLGSQSGDEGPMAMEEIIALCINKVCRRLKFQLGNIWIVHEDRLVCAPSYQTVHTSSSEKMQFFGDRCREMTFELGEGLPGRTWQTKTEVWEGNVQQLSDLQFPRLEIAKACDVKACFCVPFVVCGVVLAVCEFVMAREMKCDPAIIEDIKKALSEALQLKVHLGLNPPRRLQVLGRQSPKNVSSAQEKYLQQPLYLRAVSEQWTIPRHEIQIQGTIGEGTEGVVFKGSWRMMPVVAKQIKSLGKSARDCENEVSLLSHLRHPNLVLFLGACLDNAPLVIVSEYMDGGSLEDYMDQKTKLKAGHPYRPRIEEILRWCVCVGRALSFLHQRQPPLIHRDLKPSNLLLTLDGRMKVADFGLAKIVRSATNKSTSCGDTYEMTGGAGTLRYMAPEVLLNEKYNDSVDVYSWGLVMWYMCTGSRPLEIEMRAVINAVGLPLLGCKLKQGLRPDIKRISSAPLAELIQGMWDSDTTQRPTAAQVLSKLDKMVAADSHGPKINLTAKAATKDPNPLDARGQPLPKKCCIS